MEPALFAQQWGDGLQSITFPDTLAAVPHLRQFSNSAGFPSYVGVDHFKARFTKAVVSLGTYWQDQFGRDLPVGDNGMFRLADLDTCGAHDHCFLCINSEDSGIYQVWLNELNPPELMSILFHNAISDLAESLLLLRNWHVQTRGDLKNGENVIRLCRVLSHKCFSTRDSISFWCPPASEILTPLYGDEDGFPDTYTFSVDGN